MDQLLIALDVADGDTATRLAEDLRGTVGGYKIGSRLFTSEGPAIVRAFTERGDRVFLDLKFHDIPNTVAEAVAAATGLGVWMLNVHASGGLAMMQAARDAARDFAARNGTPAPLVIAVTVLTSMNQATLEGTGVSSPVLDQVLRLAALAQQAGLDGVVASPRETAPIRERCGKDFAIVTPGIRGGGARTAVKDDQERTMSPADAVAAGSSYLVIGRPILGAPSPREAAAAIGLEIAAARG